ncbi:3-dehydroquinate synthase II [bacterium]|nr:3-dehydroquinate synthase II [bacterium]
MKQVWVNARPWNKEIIITALECGADIVVIDKGFSEKVKELGKIQTVSEDGDLRIGKDVVQIEIKEKNDEIKAATIHNKWIVIKTHDWKIIPLENLIAQTKGLIAEAGNLEEAELALNTLEKGVDGVLLDIKNPTELRKVIKQLKAEKALVSLKAIKIKSIKSLGVGDRVCVDTCTNMAIGEGMLVGNTSSGMFLLHSESIENPYVDQRPFRVNAGGVHAYVMVTEGKTRYLSDLKAGDKALIVNWEGKTQEVIVGRIKIEKRPMLLLEGTCNKQKVSLVLQNAETIRLVTPEGKPVSVVSLKPGAEVLGHTEKSGRHFGMKIEETIIEK